MSPVLMIPLLTAAGVASFWLFYKSINFFDHLQFFRFSAMMLALLLLALATFGYLCYVLLKPEKF